MLNQPKCLPRGVSDFSCGFIVEANTHPQSVRIHRTSVEYKASFNGWLSLIIDPKGGHRVGRLYGSDMSRLHWWYQRS